MALLRTLACFLLAAAFPAGGQPIITTVVGGGVGDGAPKQNMLISTPMGLLADPDGVIWIADPAQSRARRVTPAGIASTQAGNGNYWQPGSPEWDVSWRVPIRNPRSFARMANGNML